MPAGEATTDLLLDVVSKTALVLVVLYCALWAIRRFSVKAGRVGHRGLSITVLQSAHLGPGKSLHVIGVGDKMLLVGATSHQLSLLAELDASELEPEVAGGAEDLTFERYLARAVELVESVPSRIRARREGSSKRDRAGTGADE